MITALAACVSLLTAQSGVPGERRLNQHRVTSANSPAPEPGAEKEPIPSLITGVKSKRDWEKRARPEIVRRWTQILGKLEPTAADRQWFGDIRQARIVDRRDTPHYTRIQLDLPMEKDHYQPHLLLIPKNRPAGQKKLPAVICWTSTSTDYALPEQWWGAWLAEHGFVVLTGRSHIMGYRGNTIFSSGAQEKVYERFGRWTGLGRMVYDVRRETEYLRSLPEVDGDRIGFIGFSLSAKTAVYVAAFVPEVYATVSLDPHIAINGSTNWYAPWYLDWMRVWPDIPTPEHTVLSLLNPDKARPGFEHDHHELMALAAPRPFLLLGGGANFEDNGRNSDDQQSWGYANRAREVYRLLGVEDRFQFVLTSDGHKANGPNADPVWRAFFERWLTRKR